MEKICQISGKKFEIREEDFLFYDKLNVPAPSLCPDERRRRRFAFRNERNLYHRKCAFSDKAIVSNFGEHTGVTVYDNNIWWGDDWNALDYGMDFDFSHPFFEQFYELTLKVPQLAIAVWNSENSNYCNYVGNVKNSYLIFGSVYSEDCYYGSPYYSKDCMDALVTRECEYSYECIDCRKLYHCKYCQDCHTSDHLLFCYDLLGCSECIGCTALRKKKYCVFNKQLSKNDYFEFKNNINLCDVNTRRDLASNLAKLKTNSPHRYMMSNHDINSCGNYIYQCKNCHECYYTDRSEDSAYCVQVVDLKNCYDNNYTEENEWCLEYLGAYQNFNLLYSKFCNKVSDSFYVDSCFAASNLFGCSGLRNKRYCILNKQYSKDDYKKMVDKIINHMKETGEWGEFFPVEISPFCYNETVAQEYFPLTKNEYYEKWPSSRSLNVGWKDCDSSEYKKSDFIPTANIKDIDNSVLEKIISCDTTDKNYKIIPQELDFYRRMNLPIPTKSPDQRHKERLLMRSDILLHNRNCSQCEKPIKTSYSEDKFKFVYCDKCYLEKVY